MHIGEFYIMYGKYLLLDKRLQTAVDAAIDSLLASADERNKTLVEV